MILFFVFVFCVGVVSGASCGVVDDSQLIMRLQNVAGGHASTWDGDVTYSEVCYNTVFSSSTGSGDRTCGANRVLSLSGISNAHASVTAGYGSDVCYGTMSCYYEDVAGGCSDGELIARMSSLENAHVGGAGALEADYPWKVCCREDSVQELYWANMDGFRLPPGYSVNLGDSVQMILAESVADTVFEIREENTFPVSDKDIRVGDDDAIPGLVDVLKNRVVGTWTITPDDLVAADGSYDKFVASSGVFSSGPLSVSGGGVDAPMTISLDSPGCGNNFDEGENVDIKISASDANDVIDGEVRVGGIVVGTFSNGVTTIPYTFSRAGNFQVVASAVNSRGKVANSVASVMVLDWDGVDYEIGKKYVAACISLPEDAGNIDVNPVEFDASTSRAIEIDGSGVPQDISVDDGGLTWDWMFSAKDKDGEYVTYSKTGPSGYSFSVVFPDAGDNWAKLSLTLN